MSTIREWVSFFYADISAQLRRHCVNQHMFYGLYLNNNTITGAWLFQELVKRPTPLLFTKRDSYSWPYTEISLKASKYSVFGEEREAMYVIVIKGGSETETWSLRWYSLTLNQIGG